MVSNLIIAQRCPEQPLPQKNAGLLLKFDLGHTRSLS